MLTRELKGFIFDLDGVIVNTVDLHYRAWKQLFDDLGVAFSRSDMERLRGVHRRDILLTVIGGLDEAQISACLSRKDALYKELLQQTPDEILRTPVVNLLREAKSRGLKIGLASSSVNAHHVLEIIGLESLFDIIADGNTVSRSKPAPDIFVWVAGGLGLNPAEIIVVEDGSAGIQAALTGGMYVVGIDIRDSVVRPHLNLSLDTLNYDRIVSLYHLRNAATTRAATAAS